MLDELGEVLFADPVLGLDVQQDDPEQTINQSFNLNGNE